MNHGCHFDRMNKADRLREQRNVERARKKHEARERLNEAAPVMLEALKQTLSCIDDDRIRIIVIAAIALAEKENVH